MDPRYGDANAPFFIRRLSMSVFQMPIRRATEAFVANMTQYFKRLPNLIGFLLSIFFPAAAKKS